jgi:hypothetical protein
MFKIASEPTFETTLTITGQGREQQLKLTFKHMKRSEYQALLGDVRNEVKTPTQAVLELVQAWDADAELSADSLGELIENQPGAEWAIITGYSDALTVARKGN